MKTEYCPWDESHPIRPIKTGELSGRWVSDYFRKKELKYNREPVFRRSEKYYDFIKVLKTQTLVSHWLIRIAGRYFVVHHSPNGHVDESCSIYISDRRGIYNTLMPIAIYQGYIDLEAAADRFSQEYIGLMIDERDPRLSEFFKEHGIEF